MYEQATIPTATRAEAFQRPRLGLLLLFSVPVSSALAHGQDLEVFGFQYVLYLFLFNVLAVAGVILAEKAFHQPATGTFAPAHRWIWWFGLVCLSLLWSPEPGLHTIKSAIQICMPLLLGIAGAMFVETERDLRLLMKAFIVALACITVQVIAWHADFFEDGALRLRSQAMTLALIGCVFLSRMPRSVVAPLVGWGFCLLTVASTESRGATGILLLAPLLHPLYRSYLLRGMVILLFVGLFILLLGVPQVREQLFDTASGGALFDPSKVVTHGRFWAWPLILEEAWKHPVLGTGIRSSAQFVPKIWPGTGNWVLAGLVPIK